MASTESKTTHQMIDILIVGSGIAGTALASFLLLGQLRRPTRTPLCITILERSPAIQGHGQNIDIRGPGKALLEKLGINDEVREATTGEEGVKIVDSTGKSWGGFAVDKSGEIETPTGEIEILRGRLAEILFKRCRELSEQVKQSGGAGVEFIFGQSIQDLRQQDYLMSQDYRSKHGGGKVSVQFSKSKEWRTFDFIVGADGLQSRTRALAWNVDKEYSVTTDEQILSIGAQISTTEGDLRKRRSDKDEEQDTRGQQDKTHASSASPAQNSDESLNTDSYLKSLSVYTAFYSIPASLFSNDEHRAGTNDNVDLNDGWRRWYHAPGRRSLMLRPSDDKKRLTVLMTVLDLKHRDHRLGSFATLKDDRKKAVAMQKELMREYFQDAGWECAKLVDGMQAADDFYYDLVAQVKLDRWSKGQVCLLGDAAYCASPFSGMGTTLALVGAYNLTGSLNKYLSASTPTMKSSRPSPGSGAIAPATSTTELKIAFEDFETNTRPIVSNAQKLPPGMPWLIHPETEWGVWVMHRIVGFIFWSGLVEAIANLAGSRKGNPKDSGLVEWDVN